MKKSHSKHPSTNNAKSNVPFAQPAGVKHTSALPPFGAKPVNKPAGK